MSATASKPMELVVSVSGKIIKSNFDEFESYALEQLEGINTDLNTDEDFGQAAADEKALKETEKKFKEVEEQILAEMDAVSDLINRTRGLGEQYSAKRLALGRALKDRKAEIIAGIKQDAIASISIKHPEALRRISEAMKNKRTLESLKKHATAEARAIQAEVDQALEIIEEHEASVLYDQTKLLVMNPEALRIELERRVERQRQEDEKARLRVEAEKAKAEQQKATEQPEPAPAPTPPSNPGPLIPPLPFEEPENEAQELARYLDTLRSCLAPIREARSSLKHEGNIERVGKFAATLNTAFAELKGGQS
jgi:hypothetical protein